MARYLPVLGESPLCHILEDNLQENVGIRYLRDAAKVYENLVC